MPEIQTLEAALLAATAALTGAVRYLFRENQSLHKQAANKSEQVHAASMESQAQVLRVLVVVEKSLESFNALAAEMRENSEQSRDALVLLKERQSAIMDRLSQGSSDKSQKSSTH